MRVIPRVAPFLRSLTALILPSRINSQSEVRLSWDNGQRPLAGGSLKNSASLREWLCGGGTFTGVVIHFDAESDVSSDMPLVINHTGAEV